MRCLFFVEGCSLVPGKMTGFSCGGSSNKEGLIRLTISSFMAPSLLSLSNGMGGQVTHHQSVIVGPYPRSAAKSCTCTCDTLVCLHVQSSSHPTTAGHPQHTASICLCLQGSQPFGLGQGCGMTCCVPSNCENL
jgi:hypothetical protein